MIRPLTNQNTSKMLFNAFRFIAILAIVIAIISASSMIAFLIYVDFKVFPSVSQRVQNVISDKQSIEPTVEVMEVFAKAPKRSLYWNTVRNHLKAAMENSHVMGWHQYGIACQLLAYLKYSDREIMKYIINDFRDPGNKSLDEISISKFGHRLNKATCQEVLELEAVTWSSNLRAQINRMSKTRDLCDK